jgi:hypothetical protein
MAVSAGFGAAPTCRPVLETQSEVRRFASLPVNELMKGKRPDESSASTALVEADFITSGIRTDARALQARSLSFI